MPTESESAKQEFRAALGELEAIQFRLRSVAHVAPQSEIRLVMHLFGMLIKQIRDTHDMFN
jgi:hypothetical protein